MNPEYIEITIESGDTYGAILTKLKSLLDISKVNPRTYMTYVNTQFIAYLNGLSPNSWCSFAVCAGSPGGAYNIVLYINVNGTVSVEESKGTTRTDITSNAVPSVWVGSKARIYYK